MKALTLWQPWASLVAADHKRIETRSWGTSHRGGILIHAARSGSHPKGWQDHIGPINELLRAAGRDPLPSPLPMGKVLAVANLFNCLEGYEPGDPLERGFGSYGPDRWAWIFNGLVPLDEPIEWKWANYTIFRIANKSVDFGLPLERGESGKGMMGDRT